ncbi:TPA: cellulose biosynthesis cyclic di-GMP-binding regulatory protein BcsB [Citrobacter freundii]|nr:cellulose biosynthesis cyclic di-GMP-binding regulatory protein BcsB [Citrobacter freundii]
MNRLLPFLLLSGAFLFCASMKSHSQSGSLITTTGSPSSLPPPSEMTPVSTHADPGSLALPDVLTPASVNKITFARMGQAQGISLSRGQIHAGIRFTIPEDVVATRARMVLKVSVSADIAARHSSLLLQINGQNLGTLPLDTAAEEIAVFQLNIPAELLVSGNDISFSISDGETLQCERSDRYQIVILPDSFVEFDVSTLNIVADLSRFPKPFFDMQQMMPQSVSVAFPEKMKPGQVSAAAAIASWLGSQAGYRTLRFPVSGNRLPEKNGILLGSPGDEIGGLKLPETKGPLLQLVNNPGNPEYKLLLVVGQNDTEWQQAVWRLIKGEFPLQSAQIAVTPQLIPFSAPYDAPRWINTSRRLHFSELMNKGDSLTAVGLWHPPIIISFRAAPDLFLWDGQTIPFHINYRFPSESWVDEERSWLNTTFNSTFLFNLPVNKTGIIENIWHLAGGDIRQESMDLPLEPYLIYGDNQLSLYFSVIPKADAPCSALRSNNLRSTVGENSWIDLSKTQHFSMLPELSFFIGASFPFSRLADYSRTLLVLPATPTEAEISTLLELASRAGDATGTAVIHNTVVFGWPGEKMVEELSLSEKDILIVSTLEHKQPWLLMPDTPFTADSRGLRLRPRTVFKKVFNWITGDWNTASVDADRYLSSSGAWRGFISFTSPWSKERVIIQAVATDDEQLSKISHDLTDKTINAGIRGDLAIITDESGVRSFRVGPQFPSGQMPWYLMFAWYAGQHVVILALLMVAAAGGTGSALYLWLCKHAKRRLNPQEHR